MISRAAEVAVVQGSMSSSSSSSSRNSNSGRGSGSGSSGGSSCSSSNTTTVPLPLMILPPPPFVLFLQCLLSTVTLATDRPFFRKIHHLAAVPTCPAPYREIRVHDYDCTGSSSTDITVGLLEVILVVEVVVVVIARVCPTFLNLDRPVGETCRGRVDEGLGDSGWSNTPEPRSAPRRQTCCWKK